VFEWRRVRPLWPRVESTKRRPHPCFSMVSVSAVGLASMLGLPWNSQASCRAWSAEGAGHFGSASPFSRPAPLRVGGRENVAASPRPSGAPSVLHSGAPAGTHSGAPRRGLASPCRSSSTLRVNPTPSRSVKVQNDSTRTPAPQPPAAKLRRVATPSHAQRTLHRTPRDAHPNPIPTPYQRRPPPPRPNPQPHPRGLPFSSRDFHVTNQTKKGGHDR